MCWVPEHSTAQHSSTAQGRGGSGEEKSGKLPVNKLCPPLPPAGTKMAADDDDDDDDDGDDDDDDDDDDDGDDDDGSRSGQQSLE